MKRSNNIRGVLRTEEELRNSFEKEGFLFNIIPEENGVLLYTRGKKQNNNSESLANRNISWYKSV
jgi:hypothetical protein